MSGTDFHPNDAIYGDGNRKEPKIRRISHRKQVDISPYTTLYRVSPSGCKTFVCKTGKRRIRDLTVKIYEGDRLEFKKGNIKR